jgi:Undecaprenyl-phosphate glucose phosphotransferase
MRIARIRLDGTADASRGGIVTLRAFEPAMTSATLNAATIELAGVPPLTESWSEDEGDLVSQRVLTGAIRFWDAAIVGLSGIALALMYVSEPVMARDTGYGLLIVSASTLAVAVFQFLGLYESSRLSSFVVQLPRVLLGWTITLVAVVAGLVFMKSAQDFSRVWLAMWFAVGGFALLSSRACLAGLVHAWAREGRLYRRAVIYGTGEVSEDVIRQLEKDTGTDVRILGIFDDRDEPARAPRLIAGYPRLGGLSELLSLGRDSRIDLVIVALPVAAERRLAEIVKRLSVLPADIKLPARATAIRFSPKTYSHIGSIAMIDLHDKPITDWGTVSKWTFDKVFAALAMVLLAPVMIGVALAIKLESRGPVLFRQKRYGFNNELIEVYKFRSMYTDRCDATASRLVTRDDPRVTKVGRIIRKTSLDELPQLFNVLKGNLSLVGPRPHAVAAKAENRLYDDVVDGYFARHKVKPGITGWAQINGWRGETDTAEKIQKRVEHDLYYIENWSVFFDLYILLKTPVSLLETKNAY